MLYIIFQNFDMNSQCVGYVVKATTQAVTS